MSPRATSRRSPGRRSSVIPRSTRNSTTQPNFTWGKTLGSGQDITQANRNPMLGRVPGADGLKTGHTDEAGYGFTGSAEQNGRRLMMVLAGLDSFNQRIQESTRLMQWGFNAWSAKPLFQAGARSARRRSRWAARAMSPLVAPRNLAVTVPAGLASRRDSMKIRYQGPLEAPIAKGQHVADLVVTTRDTPPQVVPLVAGEDVGAAGFFGRVWLGLKSVARNGVTERGKFISPRGRGRGRQVDPGPRARRGAEGARP